MYSLSIASAAPPAVAPAATGLHVLPALPPRPAAAALLVHRRTSTAVDDAARRAAPLRAFRAAGPGTPEPSYEAIEAQPLNKLVMQLFRNKMVAAIGEDSSKPG